MSKKIYIASTNIYSPIGNTTTENFDALCVGKSGVQRHHDLNLSSDPFYAALFPDNASEHGYTKFESILIHSIQEALNHTNIRPTDQRTLLILSSTKGNIDKLESGSAFNPEDISMAHAASKVKVHFGFVHEPIVISNACISGIVAMLVAKRLMDADVCDHAVVAGADVISKFILSGFQSFQAISSSPCRPFDARRNGINLGEAAATVVLTKEKAESNGVVISGGAASNDANHISGPSRTGDELAEAIIRSLNEASMKPDEVDFISAHGTATVYNDEMEAKAFHHSGVQQAPLNSLKGFYGHTLGAAGLVESIVSIESLLHQKLIPTPGYEEQGTSLPVNIIKEVRPANLRSCLKTGSGFGGCNAAIIFNKI